MSFLTVPDLLWLAFILLASVIFLRWVIGRGQTARLKENTVIKSHLTWLFDDVVTPIFFTILVWSSPGWDKQSSYEIYLSNKSNPAIGNLSRKEKEQLKSKSPETWDITLITALLKKNGVLAHGDNESKWFRDKGSDPELSLTKLKDFRNVLSHNPVIKNKDYEEIKEQVPKLIIALKKTLFATNGPFAHLPQSEMNKFGDFLTLATKIINSDLGDRLYDEYTNRINFLKRKEVVEKRLPELKKHLKKFTSFNPVTQLFKPFSNCQVEVEDIFTEMVIEEESGSQKVELSNLLQHLPHDDPELLLLIKGDAGIGKSTVISKLISDWVNKKGNIKGLDSFHMIFHAEGRQHIDSFRNLLVKSLGDIHKDLDGDKLISATLDFKCLIIMDGYDEENETSSKLVQDILALKQQYRNLSLIFTSRPEAVDKFKLQVNYAIKTIVSIRLEGIPLENLKDFVERYCNCVSKGLSQPLPQEKPIKDLQNYLEERKHKMNEIWKSPYNLSILVILWLFKQTIDKITTEAELHMNIFNLQKSKLKERLVKVLSPKPNLSIIEYHTDTFLYDLSEQALDGLKKDYINLSQAMWEKLTSEHVKDGFPSEELLGAFLKQVTTTTEYDKLYSFPHKAMQEYFGAYHLISKLVRTSNATAECIFKDLPPRPKHQNLLYNVIYLSKIPEMKVSEKMTDEKVLDNFLKEALNLLEQCGLNDKRSWIRVLTNIRCDETAAKWIANKYCILKGKITVDDYSFDAYFNILKVAEGLPLSNKEFFIDITLEEVPCHIDKMAEIVIDHELQIRHLTFPELLKGRKKLEGDSQEKGVLSLAQKCQEYRGIWRKNFKLETTVKSLYVRVENHDALLDLSANLQSVRLSWLRLRIAAHLAKQIPTESLRFPDKNIGNIDIEVEDVTLDLMDVTGRIVRALQPKKKPLDNIYFRRICHLEEDKYMELIETLRGVRLEGGIHFPSSIRPSFSTQERVKFKCKKVTGVRNVHWHSDLNE